jgi:hypothetical protein
MRRGQQALDDASEAGPITAHADVSEFRHRILMQRPASPFVISNAVRGTWLSAGTHPRVGQVAESERLGAMAAARCAVRRSSGSGRPCARTGSAGGLGGSDVSSRRPGAPAVATPMLCRVAICACSEAPRTRRASTTRHAAAGCLHWARLDAERGFLPLSVTACCRIRVLLSSARLARGRLAGIRGRCCEDTTPCAIGLLFEHLGLL